MKNIKHKIMVMSNKGGVGKSTVALNLAYGLAEKGKKVGLLDADLHGPSLAKMFGVEKKLLATSGENFLPLQGKQGIKLVSLALILAEPDRPIIWRGPLKMKMIKQFVEGVEWGDLDYLIIDAPPGTGDEPLSLLQLISGLDGVVVVTTPQEVALLDSRKAVNFVKELKVPVLGIIENMSGLTCPHCGGAIELFKRGGGEQAAREMEIPFLGALPLDPQVVTAGDSGEPFLSDVGNLPLRKAMLQIVERILERVENKQGVE